MPQLFLLGPASSRWATVMSSIFLLRQPQILDQRHCVCALPTNSQCLKIFGLCPVKSRVRVSLPRLHRETLPDVHPIAIPFFLTTKESSILCVATNTLLKRSIKYIYLRSILAGGHLCALWMGTKGKYFTL